MPAKYNLEESLKEISNYATYFVSGHGHINPTIDDLFVCVPENVILVLINSNFDSKTTSNESEHDFFRNILRYGDEHLQKSLLVENDDLPTSHILKNKCIYMPGSCVVNQGINLSVDPDIITGIFKGSNIKNAKIFNSNQSLYKNIKDKKYTLSKLLDKLKTGKNKKIIYLSICTTIWFSTIFNNNNGILDKIGIDPNVENDEEKVNTISYEFVSALNECSRNCYLYSLEKFTTKFTTYKFDEIENSKLIEETIYNNNNIDNRLEDPTVFNIISNKQIMLYVNNYFDEYYKKILFGPHKFIFGSKKKPTKTVSSIRHSSASTTSKRSSQVLSEPDVYDKTGKDMEKYLKEKKIIDLYNNVMSKLTKKNFTGSYVFPNIKKYICNKTLKCLQTYYDKKNKRGIYSPSSSSSSNMYQSRIVNKRSRKSKTSKEISSNTRSLKKKRM